VLDLSRDKEWDGWSPSENIGIDFDGTLEHYARADRQGTVSIRRVRDDAEIRRLPGAGLCVWCSRDGKFLAVESDQYNRRLQVWKVNGEKPIVETEAGFYGKMGAADFSPDSRELAVGHSDGTLSLYDLATGQELRQFQLGLPAIRHLAF